MAARERPQNDSGCSATHFHSGPAQILPNGSASTPRRYSSIQRGVASADETRAFEAEDSENPSWRRRSRHSVSSGPSGRTARTRSTASRPRRQSSGDPGRCLSVRSSRSDCSRSQISSSKRSDSGGAELVAGARITGTEDVVVAQMMQQVFGSIALDGPPMAKLSEAKRL